MGHNKDILKRKITYDEASEMAKERDMQYLELDAKDEAMVENLFTDMAQQTLEHFKNKDYEGITANH